MYNNDNNNNNNLISILSIIVVTHFIIMTKCLYTNYYLSTPFCCICPGSATEIVTNKIKFPAVN